LKTEIQKLRADDIDKLKELISVFEIVFEMRSFKRPSDAHLRRLLGKEDFLAVIAIIGTKIIAGLTVYVLDQYYSEKPLAYIYDLAVLEEYQRKGVGKQLIEFTNDYCRHNGFEEVFVQADKADDYALKFYRSTKPTNEEAVVHFYYTLPDIDPPSGEQMKE
jgi:aminoglycoside 3-N-acetyltransferase I